MTYLYDDPDHPDRITGHLESPDWTDDDRALLLALTQYEASLCPGCGHPVDTAWHSHADGWWEAEKFICYACTAADDGDDKASYTISALTAPADRDWPVFELGVTTESPD